MVKNLLANAGELRDASSIPGSEAIAEENMAGGRGRSPAVEQPWAERGRDIYYGSSCTPQAPVSKVPLSFGEKTEHNLRTQWNASN